ncbi:hypothetical protein [Desulfosarcina sp.]|uniref:hypothetical protein n=1 Tax=Desulfosarcina sp. TaxID=2027861 RepID=UPI0035646C32
MNEFTTLSEVQKEKVRQERPRWCRIEYKGINGWAAVRYFREGSWEEGANLDDD